MFARELRSKGRRSNRNVGPPVEQPSPLRLVVRLLASPLLHALGTKAVDTLKCVANLPPPFVNLILPSWNVSRTGINTAQCLRLHPEIFRNPAPMPMRANKKLSMEPASSRDTPHRKEDTESTRWTETGITEKSSDDCFPIFIPDIFNAFSLHWDDYKRREALRESRLAKYKAKSPSSPGKSPHSIPNKPTPQDDAWKYRIDFSPKRREGPYKAGSYKRFVESQPSFGKLDRILCGPVLCL